MIDKRYTHDYDRIFGDSSRARNALVIHDPTGSYNYFNPWWHPYYRRGDLHSLQSVTKTITSVVIGAAVQRGEFPSIDTPVLTFFDTTQVKAIDANKRRLTIRHLLTMTGGFDWNENLPYIDPNNTAIQLEGSYDWVRFTIDRPMEEQPPGTRFNYNSGETVLLAHIFRQATGIDIEEYAARHLFVRGGSWNGQPVVSSDWVRASTAPAIRLGTSPTSASYGFKWWLYPDPTDSTRTVWAGSGFGGQLPYAFPELDLVVVFNGWSILPGQPSIPQRKTMERLARAVQGPLPSPRR